MVTNRKVIAHLNASCPFDEVSYKQRWVDPLMDMLNGFAPFYSNDRYPEWMKKYRNESTIYGLFPLERPDDLSDCCFAYLDHYLDQLKEEKLETDLNRLKQIGALHDQWVEDIRTQDKAQGMIVKMIRAKTARRIFYEVTT